MKNAGFVWHCRYNVLLEYCGDYKGRAEYIKTNEPKNEREIHLRLFQFVKGELPQEVIDVGLEYEEAWQKCAKARQKYNQDRRKQKEGWLNCVGVRREYDEARQEYNRVIQEYDEVWQKWQEAWQKRDDVLQKHKDYLGALHKQECGCKEWNGKEIVFCKIKEGVCY